MPALRKRSHSSAFSWERGHLGRNSAGREFVCVSANKTADWLLEIQQRALLPKAQYAEYLLTMRQT